MEEPVSFWFTEFGLERFGYAIDRIIDEISENNWQLVGAFIEDDLMEVVYKDEFQIAFPYEYILCRDIRYTKVEDVDEFVASTYDGNKFSDM